MKKFVLFAILGLVLSGSKLNAVPCGPGQHYGWWERGVIDVSSTNYILYLWCDIYGEQYGNIIIVDLGSWITENPYSGQTPKPNDPDVDDNPFPSPDLN